MRGKPTMFYGALLLAGANLAMQGAAMLFRVYLSRTVGAAGLGLLQLILTVGGLALTVGVSGARVTAMYLCAEELGQRRSRGVGRVLQACTSYCLCAGCLAGLTLILGADYIALRWIGDARAASGIRLLGLFLPADCLCAVLTGFFTASGRIWQLVGIEGFERLASIVLTVLLLRGASGGPAAACRAIVLGGGLAGLCALAAMGALCLHGLPKPDPEIPVVRRMLRMCLPLALGDWVRSGLSTSTHLLIPRGLSRHGGSSEDALAAYGAIHGMVFPVVYFPAAFLYALVDLLIPELSRLRVQAKKERIRALTDRCFRTGAVFACICAGLLHLFAAPLAERVYHSARAGTYLAVFAPMILFLYLDSVTDGILKGLGEQVYCVRCNIFTSVLEVAGLLLLLPRLGVTGYVLCFGATRLLNYCLSAARLWKTTGCPLPARFCVKLALCFGLCVLCLREQPWLFAPVFICLLLLTKAVTREDLRWLADVLRRTRAGTLTSVKSAV